MSAELISQLSRISGLRVVSRTASFQFRGSGADVRSVGTQLGASHLLEGSIRKTKDYLRVFVQLVETGTGYHQWSQRFDRTPDDVFAIEDQIVEGVSKALTGVSLTTDERRELSRPHTATDAYDHYLRGLQYMSRLTRPELLLSAEMFDRAIACDPLYGPAYAGLAAVFGTLYEWLGALAADLARAEEASQKAVALAPELAEARVGRGFALSLSRRYPEAVHEFEQAIRINPNLFEAYYYYARACFAAGDVERAAQLFRQAAEVRREDFQSPILCAQCLRMLGRPPEGVEWDREGVRRAERALAYHSADARALSLGAQGLLHTGRQERATEWIRRAMELYPDDLSTLMNGICHHAVTGDKETALDPLERVVMRGWGKRDWIEHDPDYDSLRDEPRFQRLLDRMR